jgi:hypothetical protein
VCVVAKSVASAEQGTGSLSREVILMARVIVLPNAEHPAEGLSGPVLFAERVDPVNLDSEHSSHQLIERVGWAIRDAEAMEVTKR